MSQGRSYHPPDANGVGENISGSTGYSPTVVEEAVRATQDWYNELKHPGYDDPGYETPMGFSGGGRSVNVVTETVNGRTIETTTVVENGVTTVTTREW